MNMAILRKFGEVFKKLGEHLEKHGKLEENFKKSGRTAKRKAKMCNADRETGELTREHYAQQCKLLVLYSVQ